MSRSKAVTPKPIAERDASTEPVGQAKAQLRFTVLRAAMVALSCVFFVPTSFFTLPDFGTEPSWRLVLNKAFSEGWGFGDRLIWTYGPLGFLESRYPYGVSPYCYASFDLLVCVLFLLLAWDVSKLKFDRAMALACVASLFTCKRLIHDHPSATLFVLVIYLVVRNLSQPGILPAMALVTASALAFFFKLNYGVAVFCLCGGLCLFKAVTRDRSLKIWLLVVALQLGLALVLAAQLHTRPAAYIRASLAVIGQYSDGGAWGPGPGAVAYRIVCLCFWGYVALALALIRKQSHSPDRFRSLVYLAIGGAASFMLYKASIVRGDYNHTKIFLLAFPILALAFVVHAPESLRRFWRWFFFASTAYTTMLMLAEFGNALIYMQPYYLQAFFPIHYLKEIQSYRLVADWGTYSSAVRNNFPERAVPEWVRQIIGTNTVDVFPSEATLPLGSGLNYHPRPVPQSYVAMDPRLEARDLAFLESDEAPRFIFQVLGEKGASPDGRYTLWEEPAVQRFLRQAYSARLVFTNLQSAAPEVAPQMSPILLLERQTTIGKSETAILTSKTEEAGRNFALPEHPDELFARIKIKKTWLGRLVSFFYRGAPVYARFRLEGGATKELRVIPSNLESGVLVNYFAEVNDPESAKNFLRHHSRGNPKCLELRIDFDHRWEYRRELEVTYFRERGLAP